MAPSQKRPIEADDDDATVSGPVAKKHRKGFRVGPENLPDGPWRRKVDRIKKDLIHKAKIKKAYKKIKTSELAATSSLAKPVPIESGSDSVTIVNTDTKEDNDGDHGGHHEDDNDNGKGEGKGSALEPHPQQVHPERQAMLDDDDGSIDAENTHHSLNKEGNGRSPEEQQRRDQRRPNGRRKKHGYFDKALTMAEHKKAEAAERAAEYARREAERRHKSEERERFRRAMAKARKPGRDGQRRLGREGGLLLEKVKKLVG